MKHIKTKHCGDNIEKQKNGKGVGKGEQKKKGKEKGRGTISVKKNLFAEGKLVGTVCCDV